METKQTRLQVVDALRGFAIVSIMLLHNIEHFDFYLPCKPPRLMIPIDKGIWTLFSSYLVESRMQFLLFYSGLFFYSIRYQEEKAAIFPQFAWQCFDRLWFLNSAFTKATFY